MKKYFKNITNSFLIIFTLLLSSILVGQTYVNLDQNRNWNADATQSTVFFKIKNTFSFLKRKVCFNFELRWEKQ